MKTLLLVCVLAGFRNTSASPGQPAQALPQRAERRIAAFLTAVYATNLAPSAIARQYIALSPATNTFTAQQRYELVAEAIQDLREGKSIAMRTTRPPVLKNVVIKPYSALDKAQALPFDMETAQLRRVYAAVEHGTVVGYFVYQNGQIMAFDYLTKGQNGPRYFITY